MLVAWAFAMAHFAAPPGSTAPLVGGIQVAEPDPAAWAAGLAEAGLNAVATTVYADQVRWDSAEMRWPRQQPAVRDEVRAAKAAGLQVVLILRLRLDDNAANRFLWHGMVAPRSDQVDGWFAAYQAFVISWARFAERENIDVLGIGSELNYLTATRPIDEIPELEAWYLNPAKQDNFRTPSAEKRRQWAAAVTFGGGPDAVGQMNQRRAGLERRWRTLVSATRAVYRGRVTYAANFDRYKAVAFWDALDVIGINAYFPLRTDLSTADLEARVVNAWRAVLAEIARFRRQHGLKQPALFTELGYRWRRHSTVTPWSHQASEQVGNVRVVWRDQPTDLEERALALNALRRVSTCEFSGLLSGVLYWKLTLDRRHTAIEPFTLVLGAGDPSQAVLARWSVPDCAKNRRPKGAR